MDYDAVLAQVLELLQQEQRVAYRVLKRRLQLDDELLEDLKDDMIYAKKLAVDEDGRVLVWTGGTSSAPRTAAALPSPATSEVSPPQGKAAADAPPPPAAERRQLTVLFCDLVNSTAFASLAAKDLPSLQGSDGRKVAIARVIWEKTTVGMNWIAEHLAMESAANVSQQMGWDRRWPARLLKDLERRSKLSRVVA
jgi:hypothetical protein